LENNLQSAQIFSWIAWRELKKFEVRMACNKVYMQTSKHKHVKQKCCPLYGDVRRRIVRYLSFCNYRTVRGWTLCGRHLQLCV